MLNKIIFINSATITYAEIPLDGNIFLNGTQGAGKSTIARAIQFFWTANKYQLGLDTSKKRYDDYYYPFNNSYIVYEVKKENEYFTIITYKVGKTICYRFLDAPYNMQWIIPEDGSVRTSWNDISNAIGHTVQYSRQISTFEEYKNILYGCKVSYKDHFLKRFALVDNGGEYSSLVAAITNIYLNNRMNSDTIQQAIINSLEEKPEEININAIRSFLKDFNDELSDINIWSDSHTVRLVNFIMDKTKEIYVKNNNITGLFKELIFAKLHAEETIPSLEANISTHQNLFNKAVADKKDIENEYFKTKESVQSSIGALTSKLDDCKRKHIYYDKLNIISIIERIDKESIIKSERDSLDEIRKGLLSKQSDIETKYNNLISGRKNLLDGNIMKYERLINEKKNQLAEECSKLENQRRTRLFDLDNAMQSKLREHEKTINEFNISIYQKESDRKNLHNANPYLDKISQKQEEYNDAIQESSKYATKCSEIQNSIEKIRIEFDSYEKQSEYSKQIALQEKYNVQKTLENDIDKLNQSLNDYEGSLLQWLEGNMSEWTENVGKVISSDVLFRKDMNPSYTGNENSIYGLSLDLSLLDPGKHSIDVIREEKSRKEEIIHGIINDITEIHSRYESAINERREKDEEDVSKLKKELREFNISLASTKARISTLEAKIKELKNDAKNWEMQETLALNNAIETLKAKIQKENGEFSIVKKTHETQRTNINTEIDLVINNLKTSTSATIDKFNFEIEQYNSCYESEIKQLQTDMKNELQGFGVDTEKVEGYNQSIKKLDDELEFIKLNRATAIAFAKDKEEFFDNENRWSDELVQFKEKSSLLDTEFRKVTQSKLDIIDKAKNQIESDSKLLVQLKTDLNSYSDFSANNNIPDYEPKETECGCTCIITSIKDLRDNITKEIRDLRSEINAFKGLFKSKIILDNPHAILNDDDEYFDLADYISDFVEKDKISTITKQFNRRYGWTVRNIAEMTAKTQSFEVKIANIVNRVNADLKKKPLNFAAVIEQLTLYNQTSQDRLYLHLKRIKEYFDENESEFGYDENLFPSESGGETFSLLSELSEIISLDKYVQKESIPLADTFKISFQYVENGNASGILEHLNNMGSEGTDMLIKAMINIVLISINKDKYSKNGNMFKVVCAIDEINKIHPKNIDGLLNFANERGVYLTTTAPVPFSIKLFKYCCFVGKNKKKNTVVHIALSNAN